MKGSIDWQHIAKVAITGAVTAVIADYLHSNYGDELGGALGEIQELITSLLAKNTGGTTQ